MLLAQSGGRAERLGADGVFELARLYRACSADLARARRVYRGDPIVARLESLVLRGRASVHGERVRAGTVREFFSHGYWQMIRARPGILLIAALATIIPAVIAAAWAVRDPGAAVGLLPSAYRAGAVPHAHHFPVGAASQAGIAGSIFTNNISVSLLVFAGGLLIGAGTIAVIAYNGLLLGALAGLSLQAGTFGIFVRLVAPHGFLELSCFAAVGIGGLRLGDALLSPGILTRTESLRRTANDAVLLVLGTAPWLVLAGTVEGFVTPHELPVGAALGVGVTLFSIYWGLVAWRGRAAGPNRVSAAVATPPSVSAGSGFQAHVRGHAAIR